MRRPCRRSRLKTARRRRRFNSLRRRRGCTCSPPSRTERSRRRAAVTVTEAEGAEYRLDDGAWQESNLFGGLTPRTDYVIRVRMADGRLCLFPARFEIDPSDYAAVGSHTVGGYVLYGENYGLSFELFVPYSVFGTDEISDYRIAAGVRSRANIPGGTETAFGAWSAAEQAAFTGVSPAQRVALADAL